MAYIGNPPANRFVAPKAATQFSGDGSTTAFTLDHAVGSDEDILVSVDGVIQEPSVAYAVSSGTTLTFTAAPSSNSGNNIFVYYLFRTVGTVSHPSNNALTTTNGTFTGDLDVDSKTLFVDASENKVGVGGETSLLGTLHIRTSDASLTTVNQNADDLIIENNGNCGISICSSTSGEGNLNFIDSGDTNIGRIQYSHTNNTLSFRANDIVAMTIDSTGAVTKPNQPAFLAHPTSTITNISTGANNGLVFGTERFDNNADYNTSTGVFTAPVTGKYMFNVSFYLNNIDSAVSYYEPRLDTSNKQYYIIFDPDFGQDNAYFTITFSQLVDMDANDTADINIHQDGGSSQTDISANSMFSMYLVA
jgi:hypothetical protein